MQLVSTPIHSLLRSLDLVIQILQDTSTIASSVGPIALDGAAVILEHRSFKEYNPYPNTTIQSLEVLTIRQAVDDLVYFSQMVDLPMQDGNNVRPHMTPRILIGGSYSDTAQFFILVEHSLSASAGALSSFTITVECVFAAYY